MVIPRPQGMEPGTSGSRSRTALALAFTAVVVASIAAGCLVFVKLVLLNQLAGWDESAHALQGALIAHDLREGDVSAFVFDTYRQVYWPPLNSWLVAAAFLVGGPSLEAARAVSVLCFVLLAPTLFLVARIVEPRHGVVAGCLAASFALTSPGLVGLAARVMLEVPGLLALSCTMLVYCALERDSGARPGAHALLGTAVLLTYLLKANYGVLLVIGIVLARLIAVRFRVRLLLTRRNLYAVLPLVMFCLVWFAYPPKIAWTWNALVNQPWGGEAARGLAGLLFFPRAIAELSGSWMMAAILWAGLAFAWRVRDQPGIPFLALLALTLFAIAEVHHTKVDRHILPMFAPMFVLSGVAGARLWAWLRARGEGATTAAVVALLACVAFVHASALADPRWAWRPHRLWVDVLDHISTQARESPPVLVLGTRTARPQPPSLDWYLVSEGLLPVTRAGSAMNLVMEVRLRAELHHARDPGLLASRARRLLSRYDAPSDVRTLHAEDWGPTSQTRFEDFLRYTLARDPPRSIVAIFGDSKSYTIDDVAAEIAAAGFREVSVREFPRAETRVYVYRRP